VCVCVCVCVCVLSRCLYVCVCSAGTCTRVQPGRAACPQCTHALRKGFCMGSLCGTPTGGARVRAAWRLCYCALPAVAPCYRCCFGSSLCCVVVRLHAARKRACLCETTAHTRTFVCDNSACAAGPTRQTRGTGNLARPS